MSDKEETTEEWLAATLKNCTVNIASLKTRLNDREEAYVEEACKRAVEHFRGCVEDISKNPSKLERWMLLEIVKTELKRTLRHFQGGGFRMKLIEELGLGNRKTPEEKK